MKPRAYRPLPSPQAQLLQRAERLSWWTLAMLAGTSLMMYAAMGNSQAMKTAWAEDVLSMVPPIAFLLAARFARRPPDRNYINGRQRAYDIAFLVAAVALTGVGVYLVYDGLHALLTRTHPAIGGVEVFGQYLWLGWLMMAALSAATVGPLLIGRIKLKLARELHLKSLHTDAQMNKADWMTAAAGIAGVAGIGMGWWWADAMAALIISADISYDGVRSLRQAVRDLHDAYPETVERGRHDPQVELIRKQLLALDWVAECELRLHEEGLRLSGLALVTPRDRRNLQARLAQAHAVVLAAHWRVDEVNVSLDAGDDDDAASETAPADVADARSGG